MIVFRGDTRKPEIIQQARGFHPKRGMITVKKARDEVLALYADDPMNIQKHVIANPGNYVSTDLKAEGGQADVSGRYVYRIEFRLLPWSANYERLGIQLSKKPKGLWPILYVNNPVLKFATIIAIRPTKFSSELTFFTSIPWRSIVAYKYCTGGGSEWIKLPGDRAKVVHP
jgi:hypothetical protein